MRISTWLRLLALCLIAGSLPASPLAAQPVPPGAKKPVLHEDFSGIGKTEILARKQALESACIWLGNESGLEWCPDAEYLLDHKMVRFSESENKEFEPPMGVMKVVKMQLEVTESQYNDIEKRAQQQRMRDRQKYSLLGLLGAMGLLGVVGGYLRLEEATKGYYTRLLRIAAIAVLVIIFAGLFVA